MSSQDLLLGNNYIIQWLALQLCNNLKNNQPVDFNQTNLPTNSIFNNNNDNSNLLATLTSNNEPPPHLLNKEKPKTTNIVQNKLTSNGCRFNPMRPQHQAQALTPTPKLKSSCLLNSSSPLTATTTSSSSSLANHSSNLYHPTQSSKQTLPAHNLVNIKELQQQQQQSIPFLNNNNPITHNNIPNLSQSSLANLISLTSNGQIQFLQPKPYQQSANINDTPNLLARLTSSINPSSPYISTNSNVSNNNNNNNNNDGGVSNNNNNISQHYSFDLTSLSLLESLYSMNDEPADDAINLIAQQINSTGSEVAHWFQSKREAVRNNYNPSHLNNTNKSSNASNMFCAWPKAGDISSNLNVNYSAGPDSNKTPTNHDNQILNYSNFQQSILETVLGASSNNNNFSKPTDVRPLSLDHSENGSHIEIFDESDDDDEDGTDDYIFDCNLKVTNGGEDISKISNKQSNNHPPLNSVNMSTKNSLIDFYGTNPFLTLMASKQNIPPTTNSPTSVGQIATAFKAQPPNVPSSTLLAKLNAVTSRPDAHILAEKLDQKMVALLEAFYAINDNPEPAAIEMIAKRINTTVEAIGDWFDAKRIETNPNAGPRSPPVKKREGGRVVTFSEYQRSLLEAIFDENNYLHPQEYEELSNLIQVPSRNIKIWFKNRRSKQRLSGRTTTTPGSANNSD